MEIALLCFSAFLINRFICKRSPAITIAHLFLSVILIYLSLFTTDIEPIVHLTQSMFGKAEYFFVRSALYEPCIWIYSSHFAIFIVEILMLILVHIGTIAYVAKKFVKNGKKSYVRKTKPNFDWAFVPARFLRTEQKIYLNNCSLLI